MQHPLHLAPTLPSPARRAAPPVLILGLALAALLVASPAAAQSCPSWTPVDCGDGTCCSDATPVCCGAGRCAVGSCTNPCPDVTPVDCGGGICAATSDGCASARCAAPYPYACADGTCAATPSECAGGPVCPGTTPYVCSDGRCVSSPGLCGTGGLWCPGDRPFACGDGSCVTSADACLSGVCSGEYVVDCGDGTCGLTSEACLAGGDVCPREHPIPCEDTICCPDDRSVCCGDGTCGATVDACAAGEGTPGVDRVEGTVPRSSSSRRSTTETSRAPMSVCAVSVPGAAGGQAAVGWSLLAALLAVSRRRRVRSEPRTASPVVAARADS